MSPEAKRGVFKNPRLFRFLLRLQLLDLPPLLFDLLLLRLQLLLGLLICGFVILHLVANRITGHATKRASDRGACTRRSHRSSDNSTRTGANRGPRL